MLNTFRSLFERMLDRDAFLTRARRLGAVRRHRKLHALDVLLALVRCCFGDEHRSVASARRLYQDLTGFMPEESSFYGRLTPEFAELTWDTFLRLLARANRVQRREVARALGVRVRDVRVVDASSVSLPKRAAAHFPSTDSKLGGFKLTATLSLLEDLLLDAHVTDARRHDRRAFELPSATEGVLWLMDRGYADHRLCAQIADGGGFFIIRLKSLSMPVVTHVRCGLAKKHRGRRLRRDLPIRGVVDLDARFAIGYRDHRVFRVVAIAVDKNKKGKPDWICLATNLPTRVAAETVLAFYRLRWGIENLFRVLKSVGRLDELRTGKPEVVRIFIAATLIGLVLSQILCAAMRTARPGCEPSPYRVFALLLANFGALCAAHDARARRAHLQRFVQALWREGLNPNPGRPYARARHLRTLREGA